MRPFSIRIIACLALALLATCAQACPSCKEALSSADPERVALVRGYFWSILFMLSMPFTLLTTFGVYMYVLIRRARREAENTAAQPARTTEPELVESNR